MEIKIGDKVRFLDAIGGGVVTSFKGKDMVMVLEDDGFETPILKRQCVVIEEPKKLGASVRPPVVATEPVKAESPKPVQPKQPETREGEILNINLAFLPVEGRPFTDAQFECYLINESNYTLVFNYASCSGKTWKSRSTGEIEPNSRLFIEEFGREDIAGLEKLSFQCLAYKPGAFYTFKNAVSVEIRLETVKFYKIHCFRDNDYFEENALIVPVVRCDVPEKSLNISAEEIKQAMREKTPEEKPRISQPLQKKAEILEVDLHIDSLLDTTAGMDNAAILNYQLTVFRETMDENRSGKGAKIVFIHGKGDGVLRAAILNELRTKYKSCKYQDASFREYGFGATMVTVF
jgi:hypothetical protein